MKAKKQLRNILAMLFCCVAVLILMTTSVYAEPSEVKVNGIVVTEANQNDVLGDGFVSYNFDTNTLTVDGCITTSLSIEGNGSTDIVMQSTGNPVVSGSLNISKANNVSIKNPDNCPTINGDVTINCSGNVDIDGNQGNAIKGKLTIENAANVTVKSSRGNITIIGGVEINCTGDVEIISGTNIAVTGAFTVTKAANVTVDASQIISGPAVSGNASIDCSGNVNIDGGQGFAVYGKLTVENAVDVSVKSTGSSPTISSDTEINCTGDVIITSGTHTAIGNNFTVTKAANVTIDGSRITNGPAFSRDATISCSGNVDIDGGQGFAIGGKLTVNSATDVSVKSAGNSPTICGNTEIKCTGDVDIENTISMAISCGNVSILNANNVTVKGAGSYPVVAASSTSIVAAGKVTIQRVATSDSPYAISGSLTFTQADNRTYAIKAGATPDVATLIEEKAGDAQYSVSSSEFPHAKTLVIEPVRYSVSFNANGGTGTMDTVDSVLGTYTLPSNGFTAPEGKQFKGWATSADGAIISGSSIEVTSATTLYAIWEDIPHTHSYSAKWKSDATNHWHECECGAKADAAVHSFKWVIDKEATATEKGSKHEECKDCGYQKAAVEIPAKGETISPETGDHSMMQLWFVLLFVSGAGIFGTMIYNKRKKAEY